MLFFLFSIFLSVSVVVVGCQTRDAPPLYTQRMATYRSRFQKNDKLIELTRKLREEREKDKIELANMDINVKKDEKTKEEVSSTQQVTIQGTSIAQKSNKKLSKMKKPNPKEEPKKVEIPKEPKLGVTEPLKENKLLDTMQTQIDWSLTNINAKESVNIMNNEEDKQGDEEKMSNNQKKKEDWCKAENIYN